MTSVVLLINKNSRRQYFMTDFARSAERYILIAQTIMYYTQLSHYYYAQEHIRNVKIITLLNWNKQE